MKKASKVMYIIGKIFAILDLVGGICGVFAGAAVTARPELAYKLLQQYNLTEGIAGPEDLKQKAIVVVFSCLFAIVIAVVVLSLINKAIECVETGKKNNKLHIAMIVLGVFSDLFVLLGGAFALGVGETPAKTETQEKVEEKPEEKKE